MQRDNEQSSMSPFTANGWQSNDEQLMFNEWSYSRMQAHGSQNILNIEVIASTSHTLQNFYLGS